MKPIINTIEVPRASEIGRALPGAYFRDCYDVQIDADGQSALELYLSVAARTPRWVNTLMALRNRVVALVGLKNLGHLGVDRSKPAHLYRVGDRVGIFSLLYLTEHEIILGDSDKHLDVKVSVCKVTLGERKSIAVSTVVHVHNALGKVYMFLIAPVHKIIAPAMLARSPLLACDA